ncbi:DUF5320 domain-containing protein [Candidatus Nitrosocosmicus arcticus]|uniref:DUF5320 domain-containing protein n=1 Tax=Candidatus Nitrosocosmicus arcticus TaxID=2035267 RepID=A0A557SXG4_9ARCH|nr:DUF5320 domain-containing protein [Candidatus Nitrosocosmicus arcticus]TVP41297.1 hypothetical protein NARC_30011 [Candidatus Nitrosocosmicus arcticus]
MGCGCNYSSTNTGGIQKSRSFLTREEKVELLKEYWNDLEREVKGVSERIKELETS